MEIQLRMVLLSVGILILLLVVYDFFKKKIFAQAIGLRSFNKSYLPNKPEKDHVPQEYVNDDIYQKEHIGIAAPIIEPLPAVLDKENTVISKEEEENPQHIITISILSRDEYGFIGEQLLSAITKAGLKFGKGDIFHYIENDETLFSCTTVTEPGYFILDTIRDEHILGITLILLPEQASDPELAFDKLIRIAKQIAFAVNGELLDHFKNSLTLTTIEQYRDEVRAIISRK